MMPQTQSALPVFSIGSWVFSPAHGESVRILDVETVWSRTVYEVWIPGLSRVERVPAGSLASARSADAFGLDRVTYAAAAARIADALTQDVLLAPLQAGVIPLPHQLYALGRAMAGAQVRFLLADEVGLGKTIEAGLIFRELKLRGLVKRVLVVTPKGLVTQWVQEMHTHFGEEFRLLIPGEFSNGRTLTSSKNGWRQFEQVVCSVDSIKPIERRRGWSAERVEQYNQERLGDLIAAGWDLIICDEAHRLGGSTEQVARFRLGRALADAAPYLLLLSATPHQGKSDSFQRTMTLLDREEFMDADAIRKEKVAPFVIRTEKRRAIDDRGEPLFLPRVTKLIPVRWDEKHGLQRQLYEAVTEYVREGYDQAIRENRQYLGFLMIMMQRLVTSSTMAIASALGRRQEVLQFAEPPAASADPVERDLAESDGQDQLEDLLAIQLAGLENEQVEVKRLLDLAQRCAVRGPDARADALLDILYECQRAENDPDLKALVFTEFVSTQEMLSRFLEQHGFSVVSLNGSMDLEERRQVQQQFAGRSRVLVSTDAGGEGLNLQCAHVVVNYDLPWNPMRIEQRIGRVDRIGQAHPVKAFNLIFEESVERRLQEVLEEKLRTILEEFGVDKTQDLLDTGESGAAFEKLYAQAILNPEGMNAGVADLVREVRAHASKEQSGRSLYDEVHVDPAAAQQLSSHPLPYWVERMTTAYLRAEGGTVQRDLFGYRLTWPDGSRMDRVTFHSRDAQARGLSHVSLEDARIRRLVQELPRASASDPVGRVNFPSLPGIVGFWSLWRISLDTQSARDARILPLFHHDDGRLLLPTARRIWDSLLDEQPDVVQMGTPPAEEVQRVLPRLRSEAERQGQDLFETLLSRRHQQLKKEQEKGQRAFQVRREALNRIGLPEVRQHRLARLDEEEATWAAEQRRREQILPELQPLIILRVEAGND